MTEILVCDAAILGIDVLRVNSVTSMDGGESRSSYLKI